MKCPKCGKEMQIGEIASCRGDSKLFWLPKTFTEKHWFNTYSHSAEKIESEGGMIIKGNCKIKTVTPSYGCTDCKLIVVDCG